MKNTIRIATLCGLTMLCLASGVYAQEKKGKARDYAPAKERDYPPVKEREYPPEKERDYPPAKERDYPQTGGFKGSSQTNNSILVAKKGQVQAIPAASAKKLSYDTPVMLVGNITQSLGEDLYTFKDSSGEIAVRITRGDWKGLSIEESDSVVIAGYVKTRSDGQVEIDVKVISKAKT